MANYKSSVQWKKTIQGFTYALGNASEHLTNWAKEWMSEATSQAIREIDDDWPHGAILPSGAKFGGSRFYPWYTGQLHDSVAGIVSDRHRVISVQYMPQEAFTPQTYKGQKIIGHDWAVRGAMNISRVLHFVPGIRASIVVGVPYAEDVNESTRHLDFIQELTNQFVSKVEDYFTIKAQGYRTRVYVADTKKP